MSLSIEDKKEVVAEVSARLAKAQAIVLAEYRGLAVEEITVLRKEARASGVYLRVLKNTLARRAVKGTPFEKLSDQMVGPLAYGISDDPVAAAKVLQAYAKKNEKLVIKGGAMPNVMMTAKEVGRAPFPGDLPALHHASRKLATLRDWPVSLCATLISRRSVSVDPPDCPPRALAVLQRCHLACHLPCHKWHLQPHRTARHS